MDESIFFNFPNYSPPAICSNKFPRTWVTGSLHVWRSKSGNTTGRFCCFSSSV